MASTGGAKPGGSLSDLIPGGLGGLLGGAAAGSVLSGGLGNLIKEFQDSGHGRAAQSWVGTGPNQEIAPNELANALGSDTIDALSRQTGVGRGRSARRLESASAGPDRSAYAERPAADRARKHRE